MRKGSGSVYDKWNISFVICDTDIPYSVSFSSGFIHMKTNKKHINKIIKIKITYIIRTSERNPVVDILPSMLSTIGQVFHNGQPSRCGEISNKTPTLIITCR